MGNTLSSSTLQSNSWLSLQAAKYFAIAKVNFANSATYLINLISRSGLVLIRLWIFVQLYEATFAEQGVQIVNGLSITELIWMLMIAQSLEIANRPSMARTISEEIQTGNIAYAISKPYSYTLFHCTAFLGRSIPLVVFNLIIGSIIAYLLVGSLNLTVSGVLLGSINLLLGYTLDFTIAFIIGLTSFWLENIEALIWWYHKARMIFGGLILPIALFPEHLQKIAELLPFSHLYYTAARQIINFDFTQFIYSTSLQIIWIMVFACIGRIIFSYGIKQLSINGG